MTAARTVLLIPDAHIPDHNVKAINNLVAFVNDYQPDEIVQTGDLMDMKGPARWSKGSAVEYEDDFQRNIDATVKVLGMFREVHDGPFTVLKGNHDVRAEVYLEKYAPALRSLRAFQFQELLEFRDMDIDLGPKMLKLAAVNGSNWYATHGDQGSLAKYAGGTAVGLARTYGVNVVCGHTHRQGVIHETTGLAQRTVTGFELGHVMNPAKADYLKLPPNWQSGFGILHVGSNYVVAEPVQISKSGAFVVSGVQYS